MKELVGTVISVNISEKKGTEKREVEKVILKENWGIENDAHAGNWHRQVSLLSYEKVEEFNERGGNVINGDFGENIVVAGIDFKSLPIGTKFYCNGTILELTQIGKQCHQHCTIYHRVGDCIMPREGVFSIVIKGGEIYKGCKMFINPPIKTAILTASDSGAKGEREDKTTEVVYNKLLKYGYDVIDTKVVEDDIEKISEYLISKSDNEEVNLIITTGGTGFSKRDVTPEATMSVIEKYVPGICEVMRAEGMKITKRAMLSRAVCGIRKNTLILNLPGGPKAADEDLEAVIDQLRHGINILLGSENNCARK